MFVSKWAIERWYTFPSLDYFCTILCKTEYTEIASFQFYVVCYFANEHTKHVKVIT